MFDRVVVVDWSANAAPKRGRDSIWICVHERAAEASVVNVATRAGAEAMLVELFEADRTSTTLVGVDFSLGYPTGTADELGLTGAPWAAMWDLLAQCVVDDDHNANNRFAVAARLNRHITGAAAPFWGCPPSATCEHLTSTKPPELGPLAEYRHVETVLRAQGHRPFSAWQLLGAGAVGSQSLLGIGRVQEVRRRFPSRVSIWPFTTGLARPRLAEGAIVVAEVWPSMLPIDRTDRTVRDAAQVSTTARWLLEADRSGELGSMFSPSLSPDVSAAAVAEEGWVLGVVP